MAPINRTYNRLAQLTWILGLAFLFASCTDMDINFQVNGDDALTGTETPDQLTTPDTAAMLKVYVGDTVVFRNTTEPESDISSIKWDIDGNGVVDERFNDINGFKTVFTKPGNIKASLWINNTKEPVVKWIKVIGDFDLFTEIIPEIEFISPARRIEDTDKRYFDIEAIVTELYASDSIVLLHNDKPVEFEFDEGQGKITQRVELNRGENRIEILAFPLGDELIYTQAAIINYLVEATSNIDMPPRTETAHVVADVPIIVEPEPEKENDPIFELDEPEEIIEVTEVEPEAEPEVEKPVEINLANTAKAGYESKNVGSTCQSDLIESYTFTITPSVLIKLDDFLVFSDACGGLQIKISSAKGTVISTTETLTKGKSQISFGFMTEEVYLDANVKYTVSLKAVSGNSNCQNPVPPKLMDTKSCDPSLRKRPHLTTKFKGKSIVHDITYSY